MVDSEPSILIVEGDSDLHIVRQIRARHVAVPEFSIHVAGNVNKVLDSVGPALLSHDRRAVGILLDADDDPSARWNELTNRLLEEGLDAPPRADSDGTIIDSGSYPRIGVWMMPDNQSPGDMEDFVRDMIPDGDPVWPRSQRNVEGIPPAHRRFRPAKLLRAQLYAWLATREIPERMGAAIGAGDLDATGPSVVKFADWLKRLFE